MKKSFLSAIILACGILVFAGLSHAESYVSGYLGAAIPHESDWVDNTGFGGSGTLEFDAGFALGAKAGHWFTERNAPYFGIEVDLNANFPDLNKITVSGIGLDAEADVSVYAGAVNVLLRYPEGDMRPYFGVGFGLVSVKISDGTILGIPFTGDDDSAFGWQLLAGLDYTVNPNVSVFAEYKYTRADLEFSDPTAIGMDVDSAVSQIYGGVSYHF